MLNGISFLLNSIENCMFLYYVSIPKKRCRFLYYFNSQFSYLYISLNRISQMRDIMNYEQYIFSALNTFRCIDIPFKNIM